MVLGNGIRIIWLDEDIGQDGECREFKRKFQTTLALIAEVPPDNIDVQLRTSEENVGPIYFVHTSAKAIELIKTHHDKHIIFIASGSFSQHMVPLITVKYPYVHRFYIFSRNITQYNDFSLTYKSCLQMFDHGDDLLIQLVHDISSEIIKQGETYLELIDAENALKCFEHCLALIRNTNEINDTCLKQLNGDENNIGLIQQAKDMLNQTQRKKSITRMFT